MALKQPRVPEYNEGDGTGPYLKRLVLFLKDFSMDVWKSVDGIGREMKGMDDSAARLLAAYPVGAIYLSVDAADPGSLFGGAWEALADGFPEGGGDGLAVHRWRRVS